MTQNAPDLLHADVFTDDAVAQDPFTWFEGLRESGPIVELPGRNVVAVVGYDEGVAIFRDDQNFSAINTVTGPFLPLDYDPARDIDEQIEEARKLNHYLDTIMSKDEARHAKS